MPEHSRRPLNRRIQARVMRVVNVPMRFVLGLPVATPLSRRLMLVFLTGRRTGRSYRQPVSYVRQGGTLLTPGGGAWKRNLVEGRPERIRLQGHDVSVRPEIVRDPAEIERLLEVMAASNPAVMRFVRIPRAAGGRLDPAALGTAVRHGFRIIRWHLPAPGGAGAVVAGAGEVPGAA
jgi:hypothetical protein